MYYFRSESQNKPFMCLPVSQAEEQQVGSMPGVLRSSRRVVWVEENKWTGRVGIAELDKEVGNTPPEGELGWQLEEYIVVCIWGMRPGLEVHVCQHMLLRATRQNEITCRASRTTLEKRPQDRALGLGLVDSQKRISTGDLGPIC